MKHVETLLWLGIWIIIIDSYCIDLIIVSNRKQNYQVIKPLSKILIIQVNE